MYIYISMKGLNRLAFWGDAKMTMPQVDGKKMQYPQNDVV